MPYGSPHTSTLPTVGSTAGPTYATQINAAIEELRETLDTSVSPSGMDMNDDLSFLSGGTYNGITDLGRANFEDKSAAISAATNPRSVYVVDGELYFNDGAGNQIQITTGGVLNSASTGAITGSGYGSSGVEVTWDAGTEEYRFRSGSATDNYGDLKGDDFLLSDGSSNFVRVTAQAMSADYTMTLPAAVPASTSLVTMSSAGTLATSRDPSVDTVTTTGLITAGGGVTASAGQDFTVSGTGRYNHGDRTLYLSAMMAEAAFDSWTHTALGYITGLGTGGNDSCWIGVALDEGKRITSAAARVRGDTVNTITVRLMSYLVSSGTLTELATETSALTATNQTLLLTTGNVTVTADTHYYFEITKSGSDNDLRLYYCSVTYDQP